MNQKNFTKLALLGVTSGALIAANSGTNSLYADQPAKTASAKTENGTPGSAMNNNEQSDDNGNYGYTLLNEDELLIELNEQGEDLYMSLSKEGKDLARQVASQRCNGTNLCKGLNACQTEKNACAGQGSCKGLGKCGFSDKNLAVKVVAKKMAEKRKEASSK